MSDLNRKMAELMGWKWDLTHWVDGSGEHEEWIMEWDPTHNIADAFKVADKLFDKYELDLQHDKEGWFAIFVPHKNIHLDYSALAETAPLAICKAAEKVMDAR